MDSIRTFSVTAGLTITWCLSIWTKNYEEFSQTDSITLLLHCVAILLSQFFLYAFLVKLAKNKIAPDLLNATYCVFNLYTVVLVHIGTIARLGATLSLLLIAGLLIGFYSLFKLISKGTLSVKLVHALVVLFVLQVFGDFLWNQHQGEAKLAETAKFPKHFTFPKFKQTPNVYLISFDALIPEAIAAKFLNIEEIEYISVMRDADLRIFKNAFSDRVPTKESLNSILAMDLAYFDSMPAPERYLFASGQINSPLYEIFRRNGYKVQFFYSSSYFGASHKAKLDHYGVANDGGLCDHIDNDYSLMGYCLSIFSDFRVKFFEKGHSEYPKLLIDRIKEVGKSPNNWLTLAYVYSPGHTKTSFDPYNSEHLRKYGEAFREKRDFEAAAYIKELIRAIYENDPSAVLLIFGDHGAWISRGLWQKKQIAENSPLTREEIFQDRHAIAAALYPKDFCRDDFEEPIGIVRIGRNIVKCLSGGKDPLPAFYQANDDDFLEYKYE
ncbi:MAG: hypothetical protein OEU36_21265 [Gammaproteobacteria bacterium]|nr:hypothetical protein [Gammaproteobacteria bacterium]